MNVNCVRKGFAGDKDVVWVDVVMEETYFVDLSQCVYYPQQRFAQLLLCKVRKLILSHEA